VRLLDLGDHRLDALILPQHIFHVVAPDLVHEFPPLNTLDNRPNNLPRQTTALVGRERETAEVAALVRRPDVALVTLTGPGGTGKTRLALQASADLLDDFPQGVWFVELAPITDKSLVISTITQALGIQETAGLSHMDTLKEYLRDRQTLLLLDNFEQVAEAAPDVSQLLAACPRLKVMVTSRLPLRIRGEREYAVPPLGLPPIEAVRGRVGAPLAAPHIVPLQPDTLTQYESVRLFIERAQAVKADFEVTNDNAPAVAEICTRLDGLPLAIELAAARVRLLPPQAMLARLQSRLKLLTGGARDVPARQQTLRNAIEWSYDLLAFVEQQLFRRLAVFQGGRTLEALEAVCNADGDLQLDVLEGVGSLVEKNLLQQREGHDGEPRFWMLETIHEYAREKLEESGEADALRRAHARYFVELAERAEPHVVSHDQVEWMDRLDEEIDNLRAVLDWSLSAERNDDSDERDGERKRVEVGLRLGAALDYFWRVRGYGGEVLEKLEKLLVHPLAAARTIHLARTLMVAGMLSRLGGRNDRGQVLCEEAVQIARESGNQQVLARALHWLGVTFKEDQPEKAEELLSKALELSRQSGDKWGIAHALGDLGGVKGIQANHLERKALHIEALEMSRHIADYAYAIRMLSGLSSIYSSEGQYDTAEMLIREALDLARQLKDKAQTVRMLASLGSSYMKQGRAAEGKALLAESMVLVRELPSKSDLLGALTGASFFASLAGAYEEAERVGEEYLRLSEELSDRFHSANARANIAPVYIHRGEIIRARTLLTEGLATFAEMNRKNGVFECLIGLGVVAAHEGETKRALRLWGAASMMEEVPGSLLSDTATANQYREAVERLRGEMGEEAFSRGWEEGRAMSVEEAVAYALEGTEPEQNTI
jgi:predicted ATPase